jgi:hypothetical protein
MPNERARRALPAGRRAPGLWQVITLPGDERSSPALRRLGECECRHALADSGAAGEPAHERRNEEAIVAMTQDAVQISAIIPTLTVNDVQKSIAFYEALGFIVDERWEDNGVVLGVMLRAGNGRIVLNQDNWK